MHNNIIFICFINLKKYLINLFFFNFICYKRPCVQNALRNLNLYVLRANVVKHIEMKVWWSSKIQLEEQVSSRSVAVLGNKLYSLFLTLWKRFPHKSRNEFIEKIKMGKIRFKKSFCIYSDANLFRCWSGLLLKKLTDGGVTTSIRGLFQVFSTLWLKTALQRSSWHNS